MVGGAAGTHRSEWVERFGIYVPGTVNQAAEAGAIFHPASRSLGQVGCRAARPRTCAALYGTYRRPRLPRVRHDGGFSCDRCRLSRSGAVQAGIDRTASGADRVPRARRERSRSGCRGARRTGDARPAFMLGYWKEPQATAAVLRDGWYWSGDVVSRDANDFFYVLDRSKEMIKYKGFPVAPAEVEAVLMEHPAVRDCGVVARPNLEAGEIPCAFVVLREGQASGDAMKESLCAFVAERLTSYKQPREVRSWMPCRARPRERSCAGNCAKPLPDNVVRTLLSGLLRVRSVRGGKVTRAGGTSPIRGVPRLRSASASLRSG